MDTLLVNGQPNTGLPADDLGLHRGLAVFDTVRTYGRIPFRLNAHLERLAASAAAMDITCPDLTIVRDAILENLAPDASIRITLTASNNWILHVRTLDPSYVGRPMRVAPIPWSPSPFLSGLVKHCNRAAWQIAARRLEVDEVLLVHNGHILEANRSNVVAVIDGRLRTTPHDGLALSGITRGALLESAQRAGLPMDEGPIPVDAPFDELYLSSTLKELSAVTHMGHQPGPGEGPLGRALLQAFRELVQEEIANAIAS